MERMTSIKRERSRFPQPAVWAVFLVCTLPPVLNLCGVDFGTAASQHAAEPDTVFGSAAVDARNAAYAAMRGAFVYTLLEWTAFCIALVTVVFSVVHYFLSRDIITPVVGTALFLSGCLDGFEVLAADMITESGVHQDVFVPLAWVISRTVNALIVLAGTAPFLWQKPPPQENYGLRYILLVGVLFALMSYAIIHLLAGITSPPQVLSAVPEFVHRPLDLIPLALYLLAAGIVLPRFYRKYRSLFARGLRLSILPHIASQLYAVSSARLYDNAFNVACALKVVGYLVPLIGLLIEYSRASRARAELQTTREQLRLAHDIQMSLLPEVPPQVSALDIAGRCRFAEVVGGDYFDYLRSSEAGLMVVLADVSGHDPGASLLMANTRAYLRTLTESSDDVSLIAARVNGYLSEDAGGRRFVTMFLARFDVTRHELHYVGAGHDAWVFRQGQLTERLESTGAPLGVPGLQPAAARTVSLNAGDVVVMATDGLVEARNSSGILFGAEGLQGVVRTLKDRPAREVLDRLFAAVARHRGRVLVDDDATAVIVRVRQPTETDVQE